MTSLTHQRAGTRAALLIGILLIAANLRAPVTGLPPVLGLVRDSFALSTTAAGALTTLPLLAFALLSPVSAHFARAYGIERTLFAALLAIAAGIALRSTSAVWTLYVGTAVIGMGIAVSNVLLPSLVKRDFSSSIASVTGAFALAMGVVAALASIAVVPLATAWGWQAALLAFLALPLAALAIWLPQLRSGKQAAAHTATPPHGGTMWRSALAWQVTLYLGLNSTIYYIVIGWLPLILTDAGMSAGQAGSLHGMMQLATAVPGLLLGPILRRLQDQRWAAASVAALSGVALVGFQLAPQFAFAWATLFGLGAGAHFILGLAFIGMRTQNAHQAASLSGMAQCVGYLLAAVGPMAAGWLHDLLGGWQIPLLGCAALAFTAAVVGIFAGRNVHTDA
ncbi:MFS transporter [Comamonas sp. UBA7528]|uniref:MFS transporter n=1 Tax=Comamonas sp. UBA7528 TaxID=1946391 RepID=UPI0025BA3A15|nr:MFS transporter [Comamonas sp. UBA7528]